MQIQWHPPLKLILTCHISQRDNLVFHWSMAVLLFQEALPVWEIIKVFSKTSNQYLHSPTDCVPHHLGVSVRSWSCWYCQLLNLARSSIIFLLFYTSIVLHDWFRHAQLPVGNEIIDTSTRLIKNGICDPNIFILIVKYITSRVKGLGGCQFWILFH